MGIQGVSGIDYNYYSPYVNVPQKNVQVSFTGQQQYKAKPEAKTKQKTGFWEGVGAFFKGLVKPLVNMVKHPIATVVGIAAVAALIIGTAGAATPFLLAAGLGLGAWQAGKGVVNAITADTREETLKALEDVGEGTFAIAASAVGAKNYAAGLKSATTGGSAVSATSSTTATAAETAKSSVLAKAGAYVKDVGNGVVETVKAAPNSYRTTVAMVKSGEFTGNLKSATDSAKLAWQHKQLMKNRTPEMEKAYYIRKANVEENLAKDAVQVHKNYRAMLQKLNESGKLDSEYAKTVETLKSDLFNRRGFSVHPKSMAAVKNGLNPKTHIPETIATGITAGYFNGGSDEYIPEEQQVQIPYPYYPTYNYGV